MMFKFNDKAIYMEKAVGNMMQKKLYEVKQDGDLIGVITAGEGFGKSTYVMQLGAYVSKSMKSSFSLDNVFFDTEDLMKMAESCPKYTVLILDESRANLYSGNSNSKQNKKFTHFLSTCRSKNLIIFLLIPSIHDIDKYISRWRTSLWINMQKQLDKHGIAQRGFYSVMGIRKRKTYLKFLDTKYSSIPEYLKILKGKFNGEFVFDDAEYNKKKNDYTKRLFGDPEEEVKGNNKTPVTPKQMEAMLQIKPSDAFPDDLKKRQNFKNWQFNTRKSMLMD